MIYCIGTEKRPLPMPEKEMHPLRIDPARLSPEAEKKRAEIEKEFAKKIAREKHIGFLRSHRRLIFLVGAALVLIGVGAVVVSMLLKKPSDTPGRKPVRDPLPVEVPADVVSLQLVRSITPAKSTAPKAYDVLIRVRNRNKDWGISELGYTVILVDVEGGSVGERKGTSAVLPETEQGIVAFQVETAAPAAKARVTLETRTIEKVDQEITIPLTTEKVVTRVVKESGTGRTAVSGELVNGSSFPLSEVGLIVSAFSKDGKLIGLNGTSVKNVTVGERRAFDIRWRGQLKGADRVEIETVVNPFQEAGLLGGS